MKLNRHKNINWDQFVVTEPEFAASVSASASAPASATASTQVSVRVAEILPTLANAFQNGFQWIRDFDDDQVQIPTDLMDLIQRFKQTESGPQNQSV